METESVSTQIKAHYDAEGYVIVKNLIPAKFIDEVSTRYKKEILPSKTRFYRQNTNKYEKNVITEQGFVKQAFLDVHDYTEYPEFSLATKELFFCKEITQALSQITGFSDFNLMQSMLFDANAGTAPHQDWWYLDTVPNGNLTAAWIAMEDIQEEAGRFYVIPKTTSVDLRNGDLDLPHNEWLVRVKNYFETHRKDVFAPALKKGDVLFWNSRTIHGALPTVDHKFSRKSLTAHYIPSHFQFGNLFLTKDFIKYKNFNGRKYFRNQPDYSFLNQLKFAFKVKVYNSPRLLRALRSIQKNIS